MMYLEGLWQSKKIASAFVKFAYQKEKRVNLTKQWTYELKFSTIISQIFY